MNEKITLDMLTKDSVSILRKKYVAVDGSEYEIGHNIRKAYLNSEDGRLELSNELQEPYLSAILTIWGTEPTIENPTPETII